MRLLQLSALALAAALASGMTGVVKTGSAAGAARIDGGTARMTRAGGGATLIKFGAGAARQSSSVVYRLDAARSKFVVRAFAGGVLWFKGHDHFVAAREFTGEARLTPGSVEPASLTLSVRAASLAETRDVFTAQQKKIIDGELRDIVLEPDKYPEITFKSMNASAQVSGGVFRVKLTGELSLHGVTRSVSIPAEVTLDGQDLRARGEFEIKRSDFNVKATSAFHGTVRIRERLKVIFDIVARKAE